MGLKVYGRSLNLMKPVVRLETWNKFQDGYNRCASTVVSDQNHMLTASHCLEGCQFDVLNSVKVELPFQCEVKINGKVAKVQVLAMNNCSIERKRMLHDLKVRGAKVPAHEKHCDDGNHSDLALILPLGEKANFGCIPIGDRQPNDAENLLTLGFPGKTTRSEKSSVNSDGLSMHFSSGSLDKRNTCMMRSENGPPVEIAAPQPHPMYQGNMFKVEADAIPGSSGGPIIDEQNRVVGVVSQIYTSGDEQRECIGNTLVQKTHGWRQTLKKLNPNLDLSTVQCRDKNLFNKRT